MYRDGHYGVNALLYSPLGYLIIEYYSLELAVLGAAVMIGFARIPDIDRHFDDNMNTHRSDMLTYIPISHRGITHTVWFAIFFGVFFGTVFYVVVHPLNVDYAIVGVGFLIGAMTIIGHIIGDCITPMGVRPFAPLSQRNYSLNLVRAANPYANKGILVIGGVVVVGVLLHGAGVDIIGVISREVSGYN